MSPDEKKQKRINDEIKLVEHLQSIIKKGLLGTDEMEVIGEEPTRRFYSGVLFPDMEFIQQLSDEEEQDPQPIYKSIAKNCNMGLEFLIRPQNEQVKLNVSGSFKIYPRVFPSFEEQIKSFEYLESEETTKDEQPIDEGNQDSDSENVEQKEAFLQIDKGLKLQEKYRQLEVCFSDLTFLFDSDKLETMELSLSEVINEALEKIKEWPDLFSIKPDAIHYTGAVALKYRPNSNKDFNDLLNDIRNEELNIPNWSASIMVEPRVYKDTNGQKLIRVVCSLVNKTSKPNRDAHEKPTGHPVEFFDCNLQVTIENGDHVPFEFDGAPKDYKYSKQYDVKGINCVGLRDGGPDVTLKTETVPIYFQKLYRTRDHDDLSVDFEELTTPDGVNKSLRNVLLKMREYLSDWENFIYNKGDNEQKLKTDEEVESCRRDMEEFKVEIESFELGIYALNRDSRLMSAFNMMNKVFTKSGEGKYTSWRLFQIVFIVRILPSLYAREMAEGDQREEEINESSSFADVLWFPTGGGKTEAYLGLIVTALFYDRLRGKKIGCTAWIRFPLRMLSKQQLDRLARVLIFAEEFRQTCVELNGKGVPFSIGFFAGGSNTDNFLSDSKRKKYFQSELTREKVMLLHKCPSCGEKLSLQFDENAWKLQHQCNNPQCFVVKSSVLKGFLPIYITDSEVYRFVPSVLCGTVDKLAILGRYREFAHIFGQVGGKCEKHGFYSDRCIVGAYDHYNSCPEKSTPSKKAYVQQLKQAFYDPVPLLFIQDELHLLKEELGSLNGHYEGALNEFSRQFGRKENHLPKIIAATATIESYERHINHLYVRKPRRYPSMGYKNGESFYATSTPEIKRRLYLGVLPHTRSQEEVIGRCLYLYHREILRLYEHSATIWKTLEMESIETQEEFIQLLSNYDLSVVYVNQKSMGHDVRRRISETTNISLKRDTNQDFDLQSEMLTGENDMDKIVAAIDRIESEGKNKEYKDKLHMLIATSLISHGVDLERINALFMAGMPSKQAEYIQASSRSARTHAGLVVVSFRPND